MYALQLCKLADVHLQKTAAAMPRATYTVKARDDAGHLFEHNYQMPQPPLGHRAQNRSLFSKTCVGHIANRYWKQHRFSV